MCFPDVRQVLKLPLPSSPKPRTCDSPSIARILLKHDNITQFQTAFLLELPQPRSTSRPFIEYHFACWSETKKGFV
jgi:hypothetical protein